MKRLIALILLIMFLRQFSFGQKFYRIKLKNENIDIPNRQFYIDSIIDNRVKRFTIGIIRKGLLNTEYLVQFESRLLESSLLEYFQKSLPKTDNQAPITLIINKLEVSEKPTLASEHGFANISIDFYYNNSKLYTTEQHAKVTGIDVTRFHEPNIRKVLKKSLFEFNNTNWIELINKDLTENDNQKTFEGINLNKKQNSRGDKDSIVKIYRHNEIDVPQNRNIVAIGYQIGGYTLVGVDYEIRFHDFFGLHFGGGFRGFTAGLKVHTNPMKNSPFFNMSYKDGGFGLITAAGVEFGGRLVFNKQMSDFGLHFQIGLAKILSINEDFADILFKGEDTPPIMLSLGIGFSW